jgi:hypothetical protein
MFTPSIFNGTTMVCASTRDPRRRSIASGPRSKCFQIDLHVAMCFTIGMPGLLLFLDKSALPHSSK